jgi:hypothetical protein
MRPTLRSTAAAVFIGGCAVAGIAVASASTPPAPSRAATQTRNTDAVTSTSLDRSAQGRELPQGPRQDLSRQRVRDAHPHVASEMTTATGSDETLPSTTAPSTEPGEDEQSSTRVETPTTEPGEDSEHSSEPGEDDSASSRPGDDDSSSAPGDDAHHDGDQDGSGGSSDSSSG